MSGRIVSKRTPDDIEPWVTRPLAIQPCRQFGHFRFERCEPLFYGFGSHLPPPLFCTVSVEQRFSAWFVFSLYVTINAWAGTTPAIRVPSASLLRTSDRERTCPRLPPTMVYAEWLCGRLWP